ncbi:transposase (plasmid) [Streptomyces sp. NBC_00271]|nr:transposase [Streptomyces sp. NBC_00271]
MHDGPPFGPTASDSTARRTLAALDAATLVKIAKVRARVRRQVWSLLHLRPGGFPWLAVAGKRLTGWIVIDIDATIITAASKKAGAAVTFKKTFGFHPLAAWCANTSESLAMMLRPGNAGANTVTDHIRVLTDAIAQIPGSSSTTATSPKPPWPNSSPPNRPRTTTSFLHSRNRISSASDYITRRDTITNGRVPRRGVGDQALRVPVRDPWRSLRRLQPTKCPGKASWTSDRAWSAPLACKFRCLDPVQHVAATPLR